MGANDYCTATILGKNNVGASIQQAVLNITKDSPVDEISFEDYGILVRAAFQVTIVGAFDAELIEVLLR